MTLRRKGMEQDETTIHELFGELKKWIKREEMLEPNILIPYQWYIQTSSQILQRYVYGISLSFNQEIFGKKLLACLVYKGLNKTENDVGI